MTTKNLLAILLALVTCAQAHATEIKQPVNQVSFTVSASEDVASDLLVVRLFVQHQAREQALAANQVNQDMAWALSEAKAVPGITAQTLDYRTNPVYDQRRIKAWQARQSLRLETTDSDALTKLLGVLQQKLAIESLGYEVSPAIREAVQQRLVVAAIERFTAQAKIIQHAFKRADYSLVSVHINTNGGNRPPIAYRGRAMAAQAEVADPSIAAGQQSIGVTVNGTVELSAK